MTTPTHPRQLGPEPLDAYRRFFEKNQREGAFVIHEPALETVFWRYFTDESIHSFYPHGSEAEAKAFTVPPWEQLAPGN